MTPKPTDREESQPDHHRDEAARSDAADNSSASGDASGPVQDPSVLEPSARICPPFERGQLDRTLVIDRGLKIGLVVLLIVGLLFANTTGWGILALGLAIASLVLLLRLGSLTARVTRELPRASAMIEADPAAAEAWLSNLMMLPGLDRVSRVVLYHRLAVLRHRTGRHAEAHDICEEMLQLPKVAALDIAPHLLLIVAEARLLRGDFYGCYLSLLQLFNQDLGLVERLQLLALQTRYQMACDQLTTTLHQLPVKLEMIDLMPNRQAAPMHGLLATAARRTHQVELAQWLRRRGELLGRIDEFPVIAA